MNLFRIHGVAIPLNILLTITNKEVYKIVYTMYKVYNYKLIYN